MKSLKSRNNKATDVKKSKSKRKSNLKGGFNMNPALALEPVFHEFINNHRSIDIFNGETSLEPLIKEDANIRIISVLNYKNLNAIVENINTYGIDNVKREIVNIPNPNEKIFFLNRLYDEKPKSWTIDENQLYDFNTLLLNSNRAISKTEPECLYDKNFPLISFFYSKALTLAYWNVIYNALHLNGTGRKLNIFNFHMTNDISPFVKHFATANSINVILSCDRAGTENMHTINSILSTYKSNIPIFIGFHGWMTVWGSNLMVRRTKDSIHLPEHGKECNNILTKIQAVSYYMDNWVRSKYTQDIITRNIRDMIRTDSKTLQFVDESKCATVNLPQRVTAGTPFECPEEIRYVPNSKPRALLPTDLSNQEELAFRQNLYNDIQTRLDQVNYNNHLQGVKGALTPKILQYINENIDKFNEWFSSRPSMLLKRVNAGKLDIEDEYIPLFSYRLHPIFETAFGIKQFFQPIINNLLKIADNSHYWYTQKLNITLDFIEITIDPKIGYDATIKFDLHTGLLIGDAVNPSYNNIDEFLLFIEQFKPADSDSDDYSVDSVDSEW